MDKNAIKKYAVWARRELIARVSQRAALFEITEDGYGEPNAESVRGKVMSSEEKNQRKALVEKIREKGYEQVMEEVAYTWFNRFIALRFMEVNGYLPSRVRVFTDEENSFKPQILSEAIDMELKGLDMQKVYDYKNANEDEALFKYLIIVECNELSDILPGMFQKISDYTELLFPDNLLRKGSVIEQMISLIPQEDWTDQVQIIGWLYQYYNTEPKAKVFSRPKGQEIRKEDVPAATQLFTPDWIVRYMVENSLGRLWIEGHPNEELKSGWKYYLDEAEQEEEVQQKLSEIRKGYSALKPENIRVIDPCQGSGHILVYMFDVLMQIYQSYGYISREAVRSIVENNLWGLDIDDRAAQLAYFSVMMMAQKYDSRFLKRKDEDGNPDVPQPNVYSIIESNNLDSHVIEYFVDNRNELKAAMDSLVKEFFDAKEYGSILNITPVDFEKLYARFDEIENEEVSLYREQVLEKLKPFVQSAQALAQKYDVVCTNPPYMGGGYSPKLDAHIKKYYPDSKSDLFAVFIEKCGVFAKASGYYAMITQHAWMFLSSYEKLRKKLQYTTTVNMAHLGARAFDEISGEIVQTTAFVNKNQHIKNYLGTYARLIDGKNENEKRTMFLSHTYNYTSNADNFSIIPGSPVAYWVSENALKCFDLSTLGNNASVKSGLSTGDNDVFLREWYEIMSNDFSFINKNSLKWVPYNKGVASWRWYGMNSLVLRWENDGHLLKKNNKAVFRNPSYYFREGITWTGISSGKGSFRYSQPGFVFDSNKGPMIFSNNHLLYIMALLNTKISCFFTTVFNQTVSLQIGDIQKIPFALESKIEGKVNAIAEENISLSKTDWDSFETSWDFEIHPLLRYARFSPQRLRQEENNGYIVIDNTIEKAFDEWKRICEDRFNKLKANEEELNRIFIDIYGLQDELTPEVEDKDVTVRKADLTREIKSLISYAVGCMFGRYSLDVDGLAYAGGEWDNTKYKTFEADKDAIIPICDDEYFDDDIVARFVEFIKVVYGEDTLEENLGFIASALGGKGTPRQVIRNYFIKDFYKDHCNIYQKRPIYWLFDSGKNNGFKCLIYLHRYKPDTIARIRTDYVHEQQSRYRTAIDDLENRKEKASASDKVRLSKQLFLLRDQAEELRQYEEKIHHLADQMISIDLDDGVKKNYELFSDVLAKIK